MLTCLNSMNANDLSSSKVTTTPFLSKVHVSPRSHNWAIEMRLKLSASTNKTLEIDKFFEIAILSKPKTFPLSYHHMWYVHDCRGLQERWTSYHCRSCVESNRYQVPNVFHRLCSSSTHMRIHFWVFRTQTSFGPCTCVTRAFGTQSCLGSFFFSSFVRLPMNLAFTLPFTLLKRKWLFWCIDE